MMFAGCTGKNDMSNEQEYPSLMSECAEAVRITHLQCGGYYYIDLSDGDSINELYRWAISLELNEILFSEGESPAYNNGVECWIIEPKGYDDALSFTYYADGYVNGFGGTWFEVENPSAPPIKQ